MLEGGNLWPGGLYPSFHDEEDMLREVNDTPYGLGGSIWTQHLAKAIRVAHGVESGVLVVSTPMLVFTLKHPLRLQAKWHWPGPWNARPGWIF